MTDTGLQDTAPRATGLSSDDIELEKWAFFIEAVLAGIGDEVLEDTPDVTLCILLGASFRCSLCKRFLAEADET